MPNENTPTHIYGRIVTVDKYYAHMPTVDLGALAQELANIHARLDDLAVRDGHTRAWVNGYQEAEDISIEVTERIEDVAQSQISGAEFADDIIQEWDNAHRDAALEEAARYHDREAMRLKPWHDADAKDAEIERLRDDLDARRHENTALAVCLERAERERDEAVKVLWEIATLRPATTELTVAQRMADAARAFLASIKDDQ